MNKIPKAFVLMPFKPEFTDVYEHLLKPALVDAGYEVSRADSFIDQQNILRDIVRGIEYADLIVADLTNCNPNVLYELGLSHGLKIPTILLSKSIEEVPFDLRSYRIQVYSDRIGQAHKIKDTLKEIGIRHKDGKISFGSPITDFLPFSDVREGTEKEITKEKKQALEAKGIYNFIRESNESAQEINKIISGITSKAVTFSNNILERANLIISLSSKPDSKSSITIHENVKMIAKDIDNISAKIDADIPSLEKNIDILTQSYDGYLDWLKQISKKQMISISPFQQTLQKTLEETKIFLNALAFYKNSVLALRGFGQDINRACERLDQALDAMKSQIEIIEAFCIKLLTLIDEGYSK